MLEAPRDHRPLLPTDRHAKVTLWLAFAFCTATSILLWPLAGPIILAAWFADLLEPIVSKLTRPFGGRRRAAGVATAVACISLLIPLVGVASVLAASARDLAALAATAVSQGSLRTFFASASTGDSRAFADLAREHAAGIGRAAIAVTGASANAIVTLVALVVATYGFAAAGGQRGQWLARHVPLHEPTAHRMLAAFRETGRGLFIGAGLTAVAQGMMATITYLLLDVPRPLVFGLITTVAALFPIMGTALIWAPLALGLALDGHPGRALILVAVGLGVIGAIDNVLRPALARYGKLDLPYAAVLLAMIGGAALIGVWGVLLGPVVVRMTVEALRIAKDESDAAAVAPIAADASSR